MKHFEKKKAKNKYSIQEDEGQSFTDIFVMYNKKKIDLRKIMDYYMASKPLAILNEVEKSRNNNKFVSKPFSKFIFDIFVHAGSSPKNPACDFTQRFIVYQGPGISHERRNLLAGSLVQIWFYILI